MSRNPALDTLLELHGSILDQDGGYWIKIEAYRVTGSAEIPHGIRYSLTLHEPYEFKDAQQVLEDFFKDVDRVLSEVRKP